MVQPHRDMLIVADTPEEFLEAAFKYKPAEVDKWLK